MNPFQKMLEDAVTIESEGINRLTAVAVGPINAFCKTEFEMGRSNLHIASDLGALFGSVLADAVKNVAPDAPDAKIVEVAGETVMFYARHYLANGGGSQYVGK